MSLPVASTISGINSPAVLKQNIEIASKFEKLSPSELAAIEQRVKYDGKVGRQRHEYSSAEELPV